MCAQCYRLAGKISVVLRRVIQATTVFVVITFLLSLAMGLFPCAPVSAGWSISVRVYNKNTRCLVEWEAVFSLALLFALNDLVLVLVPIWIVVNLHLRLRARLGLVVIFSMGFVATALAMVKLSTIQTAYNNWDATWDFAAALTYSLFELTLGLIAASLPALSFLLVHLVPSRFRSPSDTIYRDNDPISNKSSNFKDTSSNPSHPRPNIRSPPPPSFSYGAHDLRYQRFKAYGGNQDPLMPARVASRPYETNEMRHIHANADQATYPLENSRSRQAQRPRSASRRLWSEIRRRSRSRPSSRSRATDGPQNETYHPEQAIVRPNLRPSPPARSVASFASQSTVLVIQRPGATESDY
jgi:hypothetical protein